MNWYTQFESIFGRPPSAGAAKALSELSRLAAPDDPILIIAMFLHRHMDLFDERGSLYILHAGELERGAKFLRDCAKALGAIAADLNQAAAIITRQSENAVTAVEELDTHIDRLIEVAGKATQKLESATDAMRAEQRWWRLDLKLLAAAAALAGVIALAAMAMIVARTPPMSVETAAIALVGSDAAPSLVELQQKGDLKAILECSGAGWRKSIGYCQPVAGPNAIKGWNTAPSPSVPDRVAQFESR